ncbi:hypothetical protein ACP4OV_003837 [Aristida adscensionis]
MAFFLVCFSLLVLGVLSSYVMQLIADARRGLPPGPWPLPIIGNVLHMSKLPHRSLARLADRHGPLMALRLGASLYVVASSPAAAREILQRHNASLSGRSPADAWRGAGHGTNSVFVLPPHSSRWRALRRLGAAHLFSPRRMEALLPLRRDAVGGLLRGVAEQAASGAGAAVAVREAALAAMMRLLWRAMFSDDLDDATFRELHDGVSGAVALVMTPNVSDVFPAVAAADLQGVRRRFAAMVVKGYTMINRQIERRTRDRRESDDERGASGNARRNNDLLDVMLDMSSEKKDGGETINHDVIRAFCMDLLVGASDTSSNTIEWALAELLRHPDAMRRAQDELSSVIGLRPQVQDSDIDNLPYLQAVVKETLRLHSVVPLVSYRAEATVQVHGYTIPEGSNVMVNLWAIHHSADVWDEPHKFIPERFLLRRDVDFSGRDFEFLPFGSGRHACLGLPLAKKMLHVVLGSLLHRFEWALADVAGTGGADMAERFGLVLSLATPLHVIAKIRLTHES